MVDKVEAAGKEQEEIHAKNQEPAGESPDDARLLSMPPFFKKEAEDHAKNPRHCQNANQKIRTGSVSVPILVQ